eukprot:s221_g22.t1
MSDAEVRGYSIDELAAIFGGEFTVEEIRERLREFFSSCGDIRNAHLAVERSTGRSRGFGKVVFLDSFQQCRPLVADGYMFTTPHAVQLALQLNGQRLDGRPLTVRSFTTSAPKAAHGGEPWGTLTTLGASE